jgi:hypothetical protein
MGYPMPTRCPVCGGWLTVTRLSCSGCETVLEGRFEACPLAQLTPEQLDYVVTFLRCEGKFTRMQAEIGMSYPTLRSRLHDVIRVLGYEPGADEAPRLTEDERRDVLAALDEGRITTDEAVRLLRGGEE